MIVPVVFILFVLLAMFLGARLGLKTSKNTPKEVSLIILLSAILLGLFYFIYIRIKDNEDYTAILFGFYAVYLIGLFMYFMAKFLTFVENYADKKQIGKKFKKYLTKKNLIASTIALVAVIILAMPSENKNFTECGVGFLYKTHYYDGQEDGGSCDLTTGGALKLTGAYIFVFYLSLLALGRRKIGENKSKEILQAINKAYLMHKGESIPLEGINYEAVKKFVKENGGSIRTHGSDVNVSLVHEIVNADFMYYHDFDHIEITVDNAEAVKQARRQKLRDMGYPVK